MKKNTSWKFTDESSVTFLSSVSGPGEFGLNVHVNFQHTENNQQFARVGVLRDIYNTRWSIHLTHPSFLSLSI